MPLLIPPNPPITSGKSTLNPYIYTYAAHPTVVSINALFAYRCNIPNAIKFKDVWWLWRSVHHTDGYCDVSVITRITPLTPTKSSNVWWLELHIRTISDASMSVDHCRYSHTDQPNPFPILREREFEFSFVQSLTNFKLTILILWQIHENSIIFSVPMLAIFVQLNNKTIRNY